MQPEEREDETGDTRHGISNGLAANVRCLLPDSANMSPGVLSVGGCRLDDLAARYGTPLYVYDELTLRNAARHVKAAFDPFGARVSFAAKACSTVGVLRILAQESLGLDVVSAGEVEAALRAGFAPSSMYLHGNAKSSEELEAAVSLGFHAIVVDNLEEIAILNQITEARKQTASVMLRATLRLEAVTHPHLQTGGRESKFGFYLHDAAFQSALTILRESGYLRFLGLHTHLGSQITDASVYRRAGDALIDLEQTIRRLDLCSKELSVGGGWAVAYRPEDDRLGPEAVAEALEPVARRLDSASLAVEPGRAIVARAGVAVYRVRSVKRMDDRAIVAVDGGMGDNPRPALYGARYTALAVRDLLRRETVRTSVVGRYCEAGDTLVHGANLPALMAGDLICVPVSGAYQVSMASAYNLVPPPAVVMVNDGTARLLTRRATIYDLLRREVSE